MNQNQSLLREKHLYLNIDRCNCEVSSHFHIAFIIEETFLFF